jgi:2-oxoglutarate dehydrogenase E2 component (dihydrolipoamide succinyltransferase)
VTGTGKGGRITKADVEKTISDKEEKRASQPAPQQPATLDVPATPGEREERRVPMTRLRKRIAERLVSAQQNSAMLTTFNEVNMKPIMDMRKHYQPEFEKAHNVRLGFMGFFTRACVEALKRFPAVNASIDGEDIVYHGYYDVGVAVSTERGLVVPVIRDADQRGLAEVESQIIEYGQKAQKGKLSIEEMTGGTFTISNGGVFGSLISTPILNPPQTAILGMHKIQERPMAVDGKVEILPMMYLALSYDHRLIDGKEAVQFLVAVKNFIEDPARLLLDI